MYAGVPNDSPVCVIRSPPARLHGERDAEVRHERLPVLEQDVLGLDVAMDDRRAGARSRARCATCVAMRTALVDRQLPLARRADARNVSPSTNGIT